MAHPTARTPTPAEPHHAAPLLRVVDRRAADGELATGSSWRGTDAVRELPVEVALALIAARAAGDAQGVASVAEALDGEPGAAGQLGVVVTPGHGPQLDLQVSVRAYLGDFLEMGWAVRSAIRDAADDAGLGDRIGLIDVQVVGLVLPIEAAATAAGSLS